MTVWRQLSALLLLYVYAVEAFTTQSQRAINSRLFQSASTASPPIKKNKPASKSALASSAASSGPVSNFLSNFPWVEKRQTEREERALRLESAKLHRQLGLAEDATFEDINAVTEQLIAATNGNIKEKVKIEIAKDRILQLKLNARIKGLTQMDYQAQEAERMAREEREGTADDEDLSDKDKEEIDKYPFPDWTKGIIVPPDAAWRNRQLQIWPGLYLFGSVSSGTYGLAGVFHFLALVTCFLNRGYKRNDAEVEQALAESNASPWRRKYIMGGHSKLSWLLGLSLTLVYKFLSVACTPSFVRKSASGGQVIRLIETTMFCLTAMYVQLYKDPKKQPRKPGKKKRRTRRTENDDE